MRMPVNLPNQIRRQNRGSWHVSSRALRATGIEQPRARIACMLNGCPAVARHGGAKAGIVSVGQLSCRIIK